TTTAGATYVETVLVEHRGRRPLRHCQLLEPRSMRGEAPALLPTLTPFTAHRVELRQRSMVRSHVLERVFVLESQWPLGMFATRSVVSSQAELITEPARVPLRADVLDAAADADISPIERSQLSGPEFYALREHSPDEDARGVHALRSAAIGTLVRRVTRGRMPRTIGVVLDLRRSPSTPRGRGLRRCEWSLGACATLVEELHRRGSEVRVLVLDASPERHDVRGPAQLNELMTLLSEASLASHCRIPDDVLTGLDGLLHCYWIPAGGFVAAPELQTLPGKVTLIEEDRA
ncbi:MAG: DUF58 domain-containing protein, partial [Planctomycetes bacterium]|nr:DUF58 domain-containing protein [Planctomycetota bacterium]